MPVVLQVVGLLVITVGLHVWFGLGPSLVGGGVLTAVAGTTLEIEQRRRDRHERR